MHPGFGPKPPSGPPPAYLRPSASPSPAAKGQAPQKGFAAKGKGGPRGDRRKWHDPPPLDPDKPSFIGAASRKRKYEIETERFGQGDGASAYVWPEPQPAGPIQPRQPRHPPPQWNGSPYLSSGGGDAARPTKRPKSTNYPQGPAPRTAFAERPSSVTWITLAPGAPLTGEGLPELAPLLEYNNDLQQLLSQSQNILYELNGDEQLSVTMTHDTEGTMFPEVFQAAKDAKLDEKAICVALCPTEGLWAVGMGGKWKQREQAARMALCLAIAANTENVDNLRKVSANFPDFVVLCDGANIEMGPEEAVQQPPPARGRRAHSTPSLPPMITQDMNNGMQPKRTLPRDTPFWIEVPGDEAPELLATLPPEALVVSTDGKTRKALYSNADKAIALMIGEDWNSEIEFHDDANWENFPMIGTRLTEIAPAEECMTVAVCSSRDVWVVGVSMQSKNRLAAAKLALATSLALKLEDCGEDCDLSEVPGMEEFVEEARRMREGL